ncbi:MAG: hypothetical protein R2862_11255 [Thermoanaerobaculia bacterium]
MNPNRSLEDRLGRFFAGTLVALYSMVAIGVWSSSRQNGRQFATLALKTEAESVASYVAASGRLDASELAEMEREPFPIWMRITDGSRVLAETPGSPDPPRRAPKSTEEVKYWRPAPGADSLLVLRHAVGGPVTGLGDEVTVVAIADIGSVRLLERRLGVGLVLLAALMIPLATWIGRLVARRALAPLTGLVTEIRGLSGEHTGAATHGSARVGDRGRAPLRIVQRRPRPARLEPRDHATFHRGHLARDPQPARRPRTGLESTCATNAPATSTAPPIENLDDPPPPVDPRRSGWRFGLDRNGLPACKRGGRSALPLPRRPRCSTRRRRRAVTRGDRGVLSRPSRLRLRSPALVPDSLQSARQRAQARTEGRPVVPEVSLEGEGARLAVITEGPPIPLRSDRLFERHIAQRRRGGVGGLGLSVIRWRLKSKAAAPRGTSRRRAEPLEATLRPAAAERRTGGHGLMPGSGGQFCGSGAAGLLRTGRRDEVERLVAHAACAASSSG